MTLRHPTHPQRGSALLLAMLTVTLVATLASASLWQQWQAVAVEQAQRQRTQAALLLQGAMDFAKFIAKSHFEAQRKSKTYRAFHHYLDITNFNDESIILREKNQDHYSSGQKTSPVVSITIQDLNSCLNVRNLSNKKNTGDAGILKFVDGSDGQAIAQEETNEFYLQLMDSLIRQKGDHQFDAKMASYNMKKAANWENLNLHATDDFLFNHLGLKEYVAYDAEKFICYVNKPTKMNINTTPADILRKALPSRLFERVMLKRLEGEAMSEMELQSLFEDEGFQSNINYFSVLSKIFFVKVSIRHQGIEITNQKIIEF
jgi:hypothetical protein